MLTFLINETAKFLTVKSFQQCINVICVLCVCFPINMILKSCLVQYQA